MKNINLKNMSNKTGISIKDIEEACYPIISEFWKEIDKAKTFKEIDKILRTAPPGSEIEKKAFDKKITLIWEREFKKAKTKKRIVEVCNAAPKGSERRRKAIRRLAKFYEE